MDEHLHTHMLQDSSAPAISLSHRPLPTQHTTKSLDEIPCQHRDLNVRSQQSSHTCALDGTSTAIDSVYVVFEPITNRCFVALTIAEQVNRLGTVT